MGNLTNSQIVFLTKHQIKYSVLTISKLSFFVILVYLVVTYSSFSPSPVWLKSWFEVYPQINFLVGESGPNLENQGSIFEKKGQQKFCHPMLNLFSKCFASK